MRYTSYEVFIVNREGKKVDSEPFMGYTQLEKALEFIERKNQELKECGWNNYHWIVKERKV